MKNLIFIACIFFRMQATAHNIDPIATTKLGKVLISIKSKKVQLFVNHNYKIAVYLKHQYNIPVALSLAQMALESGFGKSKLAVDCCNFFGIKINSKYVCFASKKECLDMYGRTLSNRCYKNQQPKTLNEWFDALTCCNYAESEKYIQKLKSIILKYNLHWL